MAGHIAGSGDAMNGEDPTLADVAARWPRWELWHGIDGMFHARIKGATPPVMVRGESPQDLADELARWEGLHDQR
jgi:hypothetical protein